jgi:hypothetical protein
MKKLYLKEYPEIVKYLLKNHKKNEGRGGVAPLWKFAVQWRVRNYVDVNECRCE